MRKHVKNILKSLEKDEWVICNNYIKRKTADVALWTGNGWWFMDFYPEIRAFSLFEKLKVHAAVCDCVARGGKP